MLRLKVHRGGEVTIGEVRIQVIDVNDQYHWAEIGITAPEDQPIDRVRQVRYPHGEPTREDGPDLDGR